MKQVYISPYMLLTLTTVWFVVGYKNLLTLLIPVVVHEIGHLSQMKRFNADIHAFRAELRGLCISYVGGDAEREDILIAAAGPAAGFLYAAVAAFAAEKTGTEWFMLSARSSILLSVCNLLPALPLDGGRIVSIALKELYGEKKGKFIIRIISSGTAVAAFVLGLHLLPEGIGMTVCIFGTWLLISQTD